AVLLFFAGSISVSVIRSVLAMTPDHRSATTPTMSAGECLEKARELWTDLDDHRKAMSAQIEVRRGGADLWSQFRVGWLKRHRAAEEACAVDLPGRENLKAVFKRLDQTMDLYTTHATQYAGEVGPTVDALKAALGGGAP